MILLESLDTGTFIHLYIPVYQEEMSKNEALGTKSLLSSLSFH